MTDFKADIINMFKELKENMFKELQESMMRTHQIKNINKKINYIEPNLNSRVEK